jgi:hypothetical protein
VISRFTCVVLVALVALSAFAACGRVIGEAPIQTVVSTALDHTIETLTMGDTAYRSRKLFIERLSGKDLRVANGETISFERHTETLYARILPDKERVKVTTWREYADDPGVRRPAECDSSSGGTGKGSSYAICEDEWVRTDADLVPTDVESDLHTTVDVDALTRVADGEYRGMATAVYEGFNALHGGLRHITFMIGLEDGIVHHAVVNSSTRVTEWEHWDIGVLDIVVEEPFR